MYTKGKLEAIGSRKAKFKDAFFVRIAETRDSFIFKAYGHTGEDSKANATELVRRWNAFPELIEACRLGIHIISEQHQSLQTIINNIAEITGNKPVIVLQPPDILQAVIEAAESEV